MCSHYLRHDNTHTRGGKTGGALYPTGCDVVVASRLDNVLRGTGGRGYQDRNALKPGGCPPGGLISRSLTFLLFTPTFSLLALPVNSGTINLPTLRNFLSLGGPPI